MCKDHSLGRRSLDEKATAPAPTLQTKQITPLRTDSDFGANVGNAIFHGRDAVLGEFLLPCREG